MYCYENEYSNDFASSKTVRQKIKIIQGDSNIFIKHIKYMNYNFTLTFSFSIVI